MMLKLGSIIGKDMRIINVAYLLICVFVSSAVHGGTPPPPPPPPAADEPPAFYDPVVAAWDWTDENAFTDLLKTSGEYGISTPWDTLNHFGLHITGNRPKYEDGWRLVSRRLNCGDISDGCGNPNMLMDNYPHFVIYNLYTGVMRVFVYIDEFVQAGEDTIEVSYSIANILDNVGDSSVDIGWMSNELELAVPNEDVKPGNLTGHVMFNKLQDHDWYVMDIPLSYYDLVGVDATNKLDPASCILQDFLGCGDINLIYEEHKSVDSIPDNLEVRIVMNAIRNENLDGNGELVFKLNGKPLAYDRGATKKLSSSDIVGALGDAKDNYEHYSSSIDNADKWLEDTANDLFMDENPSNFKDSVANELMDIAIVAGQTGPLMAGVAAGSKLISAFSSRGLSGGTSFQFDSASLEFNAEITSKRHIHSLSFGVPGSNIYFDTAKKEVNSLAMTSIDGYRGPLGLFSLVDRPTIYERTYKADTFQTYDYFYFSGISGLIRVNPALEGKVVLQRDKLSSQLIINHNSDVKNTMAERNCSRNNSGAPFDFTSVVNNVFYKSDGDIRPDADYEFSVTGPLVADSSASNGGALLMCIDTALLYPTDEVLLKVNLEFLNTETLEVYSFVRTYPVFIDGVNFDIDRESLMLQ